MSEHAENQEKDHKHDAGSEHAPEAGAGADGKREADGRAGDAAVRRMAGAGKVELPAQIRARLQASFGQLPAFELVIDPSKVPDGARGASDGKHVFLKNEGDVEDEKLVAHEVAHVVQFHGGAKGGGKAGPDAREAIGEGGAVKADAALGHGGGDETGEERKTVEESADKAAADVMAGRKIADLAASPVTEGETYLDTTAGKLPAKAVHVILFPGEATDGNTTRGHLYVYVNGKLVKSYDACGGPPPGQGRQDRGGHSAGETPTGEYVLGAQHHHTTAGWPMSVVPWGAKLRARTDGDIEYSSDGIQWLKATGPGGTVTNSAVMFEEKTRASQAAAESARTGKPVKPVPVSDQEKQSIGVDYRSIFFGDDGKLLPEYNKNDFGKWAFDLQTKNKAGQMQGSPYFVHTTPDNEAETKEGQDVSLAQSHGCVHIKPADRDQMIALGYLQSGVRFTVKAYGVKGP